MTLLRAHQILRQHAVNARIDDGILWVEETWTQRTDSGDVTSHAEWKVIEPSVSALRAFLGY